MDAGPRVLFVARSCSCKCLGHNLSYLYLRFRPFFPFVYPLYRPRTHPPLSHRLPWNPGHLLGGISAPAVLVVLFFLGDEVVTKSSNREVALRFLWGRDSIFLLASSQNAERFRYFAVLLVGD